MNIQYALETSNKPTLNIFPNTSKEDSTFETYE
jgi:hypothetical protein